VLKERFGRKKCHRMNLKSKKLCVKVYKKFEFEQINGANHLKFRIVDQVALKE
jgi:hypothetical protein